MEQKFKMTLPYGGWASLVRYPFWKCQILLFEILSHDVDIVAVFNHAREACAADPPRPSFISTPFGMANASHTNPQIAYIDHDEGQVLLMRFFYNERRYSNLSAVERFVRQTMKVV